MLQRSRGPIVRMAPLLCMVALASCSAPFQPKASAAKVDVDTLSTDILFGVPSPSPVAAAAQNLPAELPPMTLTLPLQPPSLSFSGNDITFPTIPAPAACPTASATAFPAQVATSDVTTMPSSGAYRWATGGQWQTTVATVSIKIPLPMFEQRVVRRATKITDPVPQPPGSSPDFAFTFQTIEPRVSDGSALLLYWQVKANATAASQNGVTAGDPEAGLVLKEVHVIDKDGKDTGAIFQGTPGLLFMPLPVQPGATINSTSIDKSGNSLQLKGTVGNRERVDACGQPVQAWGVDATLTNAGTSAANPAKLHYDVATQMGAIMVAFNIDGDFFKTTFVKETARIGQVTGDAVPDQYK